VTLYSPAAELDPAKNPAVRDDPTQPVAAERWNELPTSEVQNNSSRRYEHDALQEKLARRMATAEARAKYARRREVAERPFAVIKQQFGARRFLLRGIEQVRTAWRWLATAFNLERLLSLLRSRAGPAPAPSS